MTGAQEGPEPRGRDLDLESLPGSTMQALNYLMAGLAFLASQSLVFRPSGQPLATVAWSLTAVWLLGYLLREHPRPRALAYVGGLMATVALSERLSGVEALYAFLAVPVAVACVLYRPPGALLAGLAASAIVALSPMPQATRLTYGALPLVMAVVMVGTNLPGTSLLRQSLRLNQEAVGIAERLKDQRGKLNSTIRALDDSYQLLQQTSRELALARQEADHMRDLRSSFATNLSHELRTPLNIILGFSQLILNNPALYGYRTWSDSLLRDLSEVRRNSGYLSDLVDDIVDLARVDALAMPVRRQTTDCRQLVEDVVSTVRSLATEKALEIHVRCSERLPSLFVDAVRIRQVLLNLVTNAIRHTPVGLITVSADQAENDVVFAVADTGEGIAEGELGNIFDEFYQVGHPRDGKRVGKGLGLAVAKRFVQLHGGRIWVESEPGQGSTFRFSLPGEERPLAWARLGRAPAPLPARRKPRVLVLDDDGTATDYLSRRLEDYEFSSSRAEELEEQVASAYPPVALIVNRQPSERVDGQPAAPTGEPLDSLVVMECCLPSKSWLSLDESIAAVLSKPVTQDALLQTLRAHLPPTGKCRVLVADDDRGFVQMISRMLEASTEASYEVATAYGGEDAIRKAAALRPDVLLVDLLMPGVSGVHVISRLRTNPDLSGLAIIVVSAATPGEDQLRMSQALFALRKDGAFQGGELLRLIEAGLSATGPARAGSSAESRAAPPVIQAS